MARLIAVVIKFETVVRVALELDDLAAQLRQYVLRRTGLIPAPPATAFGRSRFTRSDAKASSTAGLASKGLEPLLTGLASGLTSCR